MFSPEESPWERSIYRPGPIRLEKQFAYSALERKGLIANLDPFMSAVEEMEKASRRASEHTAVDERVRFFLSLGIVHTSNEAGPDRFWEKSAGPPRTVLLTRPPPPSLL